MWKKTSILKNKSYIPAFLLLWTISGLSAQQEITKIGVVDTSKIYSAFFKDSRAVRDLETFKKTTEEEVKIIEKEIINLKISKIDAEKKGNLDEALRLEKLIFEKENNLKEYKRIKNEEYKMRVERLMRDQDDFLNEIAEAIQYVAISEGFAIILEKQNPIFLYYSIEVDITDKVIEYLQNKKRT